MNYIKNLDFLHEYVSFASYKQVRRVAPEFSSADHKHEVSIVVLVFSVHKRKTILVSNF
jgi:hypothetical protein